jgi:hypothetical protein
LGPETNARGKEVEAVVFDQNGNVEEGLRSPQIEFPLGQYIANPLTLLNDCYLNGGFVAFDEERFRELYPTDQDYLLATDRAVSRAVVDSIVLAEDADNIRQDPRHQLPKPMTRLLWVISDRGFSTGGMGS